MEYTEQQLNEIRIKDIDFFAHRYAELFGDHFEKNTKGEKEGFVEEIKNELLKKAPRYVIEERDPIHDARGESYEDKVVLTQYTIKDQDTRIHELFHSYNRFEEKMGLKDFDDDVVLLELDEGSTEMFAQMLCGNHDGQPDAYDNEVELTRFLTAIIGEDKMIKATRGNSKLLIDEVDKIFGTNKLVFELSKKEEEWNELVEKHYKKRYSNVEHMLAEIRIEELRGNRAVDELFDLAEKLEDKSVYSKLRDADKRYGYDVIFRRDLGIGITKFDANQPTLADIQKQILKQQIDELDNVDIEDFNVQTLLELEIKKFMYDKITFQKHFLDHSETKHGRYELTQEDVEFAESFESELDGNDRRLGGRFGIEGPGYRVLELENTPHLINEEAVKKIDITDVGIDELKNFRFQMWAEKLNIEQEKELLNEWETYIYNSYFKDQLDFLDLDDEEFVNAMQGIRDNLEQQDKGLIEKYRELERENDNSDITKTELQKSINSNALFINLNTRASRVNETKQAIKELVAEKTKEKEEQDKE